MRLPRLRSVVRACLYRLVLRRGASASGLRGDLAATAETLDQAESRLVLLERAFARLSPDPSTMTVQEALRLPGVRDLFRDRGLDFCDRCPVAPDETLAEVERGHGLEGLIDAVARLVRPGRATTAN